ncbi:Solute carrier family 2, facilitated glucose transporter member 10 [Hypsibius exemplaris]|uniref:Solute carrier family 2, facilitated glucose transporter member 10 n=1 Tax=Hypsibius exemplaris TaxID=2072580 RepID=A0A1W0WWZ1_HYPEX|nr:Solute carrier family 2, facilitated glucose transporter member 10 [Hypsibius exemplaris]
MDSPGLPEGGSDGDADDSAGVSGRNPQNRPTPEEVSVTGRTMSVSEESPTTHAPLEGRPSTASQHSLILSPIRALVRTLTPKRRRPILVKAGRAHRQKDGAGEDERDVMHVTFDLPRMSVVSGQSEASSNPHSTPLRNLKAVCDRPLVTVAGMLSLIGGMSFGFDMGIVAGMMQPIRDHFHLTCAQEQVLVGCLIGGGVIVSICSGPWIDKCGRRRAILISSSVFILGAGLSAIAPSLDTLSAGRLLQGFGMSMAAISECIYVSEIAPKDKRGLMVGLNEIGITVGFVMAFVCGYVLHGVHNSWRIMMAIAAVPAALQFVGTFFFLPPSPREKMMNKSDREAILILDNLRGSRNEAMNEFASIRHSLGVEEAYGTLSLFRSHDNLLYRLLVGFSLVLLQQISGLANVLYYAVLIFEQVGITARWASLSTLGLGIIRAVTTIAVLHVTDKKGRRFFLVLGCLLMSGSLALVGVSTVISPPAIATPCERDLSEVYVAPPAPTPAPVTTAKVFAQAIPGSGGVSDHPSGISSTIPLPASGVAALTSGQIAQLVLNFFALVVFTVGYSMGFGPMTWLVLSELYPAGVKGRAMSFCNFVNWSANLALSLSFLHALTAVTPGGSFLVFSAINLFSASYIFLAVPETEGKSLEKISYDLRTVRPKQRFDANLLKLFPSLKSRLNRPSPDQVDRRPSQAERRASQMDRRALI